MSDAEEGVRCRAVMSLERLGDPSAVAALVTCIDADEEELAWRSRRALVAIGAPAVESLIDVLNDARDVRRWRAAVILGDIGDRHARASITLALESRDERLRQSAAEALIAIDAGSSRRVR